MMLKKRLATLGLNEVMKGREMERFLFLPISSFVLPEIASAEAVSPTIGDVAGVFVGRGSYPTRTSGSIPVNPVSDVLVLYSKPVTWCYKCGRLMDYPLVVKMPRALVDVTALTEIKPPSLTKGVIAWAYSKTIFFPHDGCVKYLFRSDGEMRQQIQRLSPYQEVKDLEFIKGSCESFRDFVLLPDALEAEIRQEIKDRKIALTHSEVDLLTEIRTGACLGFKAENMFNPLVPTNSEMSVEALVNGMVDSKSRAKAKRLLKDIGMKQQNLVQLVSAGNRYDYGAQELCFKAYFKYKGRDFLREWDSLDSIIRKCVDFIAIYPRGKWNWYGNDERFEFMKGLWNEVLNPSIATDRPSMLDAMRKEAEKICRHFRTPNAATLEPEQISSPVMQAIYIALQSSGEVPAFIHESQNARRRDFCFALYGAFKGYSYFPRTLIPEHIKTVPQTALVANVRRSRPIAKNQDGMKSIKNSRRVVQKKANRLVKGMGRKTEKAKDRVRKQSFTMEQPLLDLK